MCGCNNDSLVIERRVQHSWDLGVREERETCVCLCLPAMDAIIDSNNRSAAGLALGALYGTPVVSKSLSVCESVPAVAPSFSQKSKYSHTYLERGMKGQQICLPEISDEA